MMRPELSALLNSTASQEWLALLGTGERLFAVDPDRLGWGARTDAAPPAPGSIAVLRVDGSLYPRGGSGSMEGLRGRLGNAADNADVGAIILDVSSPGGTVAGTAETADAVRAAAEKKPVYAIANTLAASAAYWIASQASQLWVTPSAHVGSIGVIGMHLDVSKALADAGVTPTIITSGKYKGELSPFSPLSEEARGNVQADADREHAQFIKAVARGRNASQDRVASEFGQGRVIDAQRAVQLGMADRVGTMGDLLGSMRTKAGTIRRRSALAFA